MEGGLTVKLFYENKSRTFNLYQGTNMTFPPHLHKEIEILICQKGVVEATCNGQTLLLGESDIMIALPNTIHSYETKEYCEYILCILSPSTLPMFKPHFQKEFTYPFLQREQTKKITPFVKMLLEEWESDRNQELMISYLSVIFSLILKNTTFTEKAISTYEDILPSILLYVEEHYLEQFSLGDLASHLGFHPSYVSRLFSERVHCTLTHYVMELRISYAKHLLQNTEKTITEIAYECGFTTQRTFNRVFLQLVNFSPREFRKLFL